MRIISNIEDVHTPADLDKVIDLSIDDALSLAISKSDNKELSPEWYESILTKLNEVGRDTFTMGLATQGIRVRDKILKEAKMQAQVIQNNEGFFIRFTDGNTIIESDTFASPDEAKQALPDFLKKVKINKKVSGLGPISGGKYKIQVNYCDQEDGFWAEIIDKKTGKMIKETNKIRKTPEQAYKDGKKVVEELKMNKKSSFMKPQIVFDDWWMVDGADGITYFPADMFSEEDVREAVFGPVYEIILLKDKYGVRWSAPGYMDATEWTVFDTEQEALDYIKEEEEFYGEPKEDLEDWEL